MSQESLKYEDDECYIYILLLTTLNILIQSIRAYSFTINGNTIGFGMLLLPGLFFLVDYICKRYGAKKAVAAIAISAVICSGYTASMSLILGGSVAIKSIVGYLCGYLVSQIVNLFIYTFLINNTKDSFILVFMTFLFSIVIYYMFYTLSHLIEIIDDGYWEKYFITMGLEFLICIPVTIIEKRVRRRTK